MEFNKCSRDGVIVGTPPLSVVRSVVSLAASKPGCRHLAVHDVHVAVVHAVLDEWLVVEPPPGLRQSGMG